VSSLEEMAASIRELSVTVKQNADNAQQANSWRWRRAAWPRAAARWR